MPPDLDTLLTALYVLADDLLPKRFGPGRKPRISDAEVIALAVAQVFLDCPSERRFLRFARPRLGHLFPYIPKQAGYNKRVRALASRVCLLINVVARSSPSFCDRLRLLDSTPVPCAQSRETVKRSDLAGYAAYGYCASHSRYFWGFRLYLVCSPDGMPHGFCLAPANEPEREVAAALLDRMRADGSLQGFEVIIGDKGFAGAEFEQIVSELAAAFLRPDRRDEPDATATSAPSGNGSNRSSTPPKASSTSNATAAAPSKASGHASANASSPSQSASGTTGRSANQAAASQPMTTDTESTHLGSPAL